MIPKVHICIVRARIQPAGWSAQRRLVEAFSSLQRLELERAHRRDPVFGRLIEERIIHRELVELELHEIDEQIGRILDEAGRDPG